jgi:hypothetical protein
MRYQIVVLPEYLKAEMFERETAEETREFLDAVLAAVLEHGATRLLISVRSSRPMFRVENYGLYRYLRQAVVRTPHQIALITDSAESRLSQMYIEFLARQFGVNVRCFRQEADALQWFKSGPLGPPSSTS